jgi:hypothetical protein
MIPASVALRCSRWSRPMLTVLYLEYHALRQYALLVADVTSITINKSPSYVEIMGLDERIRAVSRMVPENLKPAAIPPVSSCLWLPFPSLHLVDI